MQEENFSPDQSLRVIQSMIEKAKSQFSENGHLYLVWGFTVFFCSVTQFVLMQMQFEWHSSVWMLCWVVVIYQYFYLRRQHRQKKLKTYADRMIGFIWLSFFVLMMLNGMTLAFLGEGYYKVIGPIFLAMYGVPTFLSGLFLQFRPLVIGGIGCWVLSVVSHFIPYDYQILLLSVAMIIAWIIPGYALKRRYQQQNS